MGAIGEDMAGWLIGTLKEMNVLSANRQLRNVESNIQNAFYHTEVDDEARRLAEIVRKRAGALAGVVTALVGPTAAEIEAVRAEALDAANAFIRHIGALPASQVSKILGG